MTTTHASAVTLHTVVRRSNGEAVRGFLSAEKAAAQADRIDAAVGRLERRVGDQVEVSFAGHKKRGQIVRFQGSRMVVLVSTRAGVAPVEKSFALEF